MIQVNEILTTIKDQAETNLPTLLTAAGLTNFDNYDYGPSKDSELNLFLVYRDNTSLSFSSQQVKIIIQIQLYALDENEFTELEAAKYEDVVKDYIFDFNTSLLSVDHLDNIDVDSWNDVNNNNMYSFIMPTWYIENDSCDLS